MEYVFLLIIVIVLTVILGINFEFNLKKIKRIGENKELDELCKDYPENIEMCKYYLKKLNNENVQIEEDDKAEASLYIAVSNKIVIANIKNSFTRIQTIAHECLHSVQNRKILMFNFIFSNIYLIYFIAISMYAIFCLLPHKDFFMSILMILGLIYYMVRSYLENDAMIKARYLAKEYMEEVQISSEEEIEKIVKGFDDLNNAGIKCVNYKLFLSVIMKILIFLLICLFF